MGLSLTASSYETVWMGLQLWLYLQSQSALANRKHAAEPLAPSTVNVWHFHGRTRVAFTCTQKIPSHITNASRKMPLHPFPKSSAWSHPFITDSSVITPTTLSMRVVHVWTPRCVLTFAFIDPPLSHKERHCPSKKEKRKPVLLT